MSGEHHKQADYAALHKDIQGKTSGGQCLWGHRGGYVKFSCCYRWQAHEIARFSGDMKSKLENYAHVTAQVDTSAYQADSGDMYPGHYVSKLDPPQQGDWDIEGPLRDIQRGQFKSTKKVNIPKGKNFTKDTWPWWNNAHHLIPKGTLVRMIEDAAKSDSKIGVLCKQSLLASGYNVNDKGNMMFLPMDAEIGALLSLPRHLGLQTSADKFDHKDYNATVEKKLTAIIDEYVQACKDANQGKPHPTVKAALNRKKLENLSHKLFMKIRDFKGGEAIDRMSFPVQK